MSTPERPGDEPRDMPYGAAEARSGQAAGHAAHYGAEGDAPPSGTEKNRLGLFALLAGIVALLAQYLPIIVYMPVGLLAIAAALWFGVQSIKAINAREATNRAMAITGIVLGSFAGLLYLLAVIGFVILGSDLQP